MRPELAALLPLLLLNIFFQNDILHSEARPILAKPSSFVHRFFRTLQSVDADNPTYQKDAQDILHGFQMLPPA